MAQDVNIPGDELREAQHMLGFVHDLIDMGHTHSTSTRWRASQFPDSGPNKVRSGMEDGKCRNGAGSFLPSFGMRQ
ncbi:MAG TPA: hypothetical protein VLJ59_16890 [Mycobacteriales bacterium]|nr:hypothetical protein [Mycobacteriales bacterium]